LILFVLWGFLLFKYRYTSFIYFCINFAFLLFFFFIIFPFVLFSLFYSSVGTVLWFYFLFCIFVSFVFNWLISFWVSFDCLVAVFYFALLNLFWFLVCVCVCVCACVCTHTHAYTCLYFLCSSVFLDFALTFVWVSFLSLLLP